MIFVVDEIIGVLGEEQTQIGHSYTEQVNSRPEFNNVIVAQPNLSCNPCCGSSRHLKIVFVHVQPHCKVQPQLVYVQLQFPVQPQSRVHPHPLCPPQVAPQSQGLSARMTKPRFLRVSLIVGNSGSPAGAASSGLWLASINPATAAVFLMNSLRVVIELSFVEMPWVAVNFREAFRFGPQCHRVTGHDLQPSLYLPHSFVKYSNGMTSCGHSIRILFSMIRTAALQHHSAGS
jgi:hypothetical protein